MASLNYRKPRASQFPRAQNRKSGLIHMEIVGARELEAALMALGQDRLIKATLKRALVDASKPAVATAQRLAPKLTGRMSEKIAVSTTLSRRQRRGGGYKFNPSTAYVWIGSAPRGPGTLAEFGTGPRYHKRTRKFVGAMPATPFMRPAWEQHKEQILRDFSRALWIQIEKSATRLDRRFAKAKAAGKV